MEEGDWAEGEGEKGTAGVVCLRPPPAIEYLPLHLRSRCAHKKLVSPTSSGDVGNLIDVNWLLLALTFLFLSIIAISQKFLAT